MFLRRFVVGIYLDIDLGVFGRESRQLGDKQLARKKRLDGYIEFPARHFQPIPGRDLVELVDDGPKFAEERSAGLGKCQGTTGTIEQLLPQLLFQVLYLVTDGGRGNEKLVGGVPKAFLFGGDAKGPQTAEGDILISACHEGVLQETFQSWRRVTEMRVITGCDARPGSRRTRQANLPRTRPAHVGWLHAPVRVCDRTLSQPH
jgi:hypothetical protein